MTYGAGAVRCPTLTQVGTAAAAALLLAPSACSHPDSAPERASANTTGRVAPGDAPMPAEHGSAAPSRSATLATATPRDAVGEPAPSFSAESYESCYRGFRPEGEPDKDVMRLGLMCGPFHGMREIRLAAAGMLEPGASAQYRFHAEDGACFRVTAVCDAAMGVMEAGIRLEGGQDVFRSVPSRWTWTPARGLWCARQSGEYELVVRSKGSSKGRYSAQLWLLP